MRPHLQRVARLFKNPAGILAGFRKNPAGIVAILRNPAGILAVAGVVGAVGVGQLARLQTTAAPEEPVVVEAPPAVVEKAPAWDLPNLDHDRVDFWVGRFTTDTDMREKLEGFLRRSGWYRDMISRKLDERGMPQDLLYLSMIESGFQPRAHSRAAAVGLWQFIAETGRRYGLRIDRYVDERRHPERATDAALNYLEDLHDRFGSWYLAAAAYNTGENRVGRIMREETGSERARSEADYYRIWDRLPSETRDYVPLMIAAARISKNPETYGFGHIEPEEPLEYEEVMTDAGLTLDEVAEAAGVDPETVRLLNVHFQDERLPENRRVALRLPPGSTERFDENWHAFVDVGSAYDRVASNNVTYRVRRGDNLTTIARKHGLSVSELRRTNGLRSDRIYPGQELAVNR